MAITNSSGRRRFLLLAILAMAAASSFANAAPVIDFTKLPDSITTNISSFPVTGRSSSTVYVNGAAVAPDAIGNDFFSVVGLKAGANAITLRTGNKTYTKTVEYDPSYSTAGKELVYANVKYKLPGGAGESGTIVANITDRAFIGVLRGIKVNAITRDGGEIITNTGQRWSTATNRYTGRTLPNFTGSRPIFSIDGSRAYYNYWVADMAANSIVANLSESIFSGDILPDGSRVITYNAMLDTATNAITKIKNVSYGSGIKVDPTGKHAWNVSYGSTIGTLKINTIEEDDFTPAKQHRISDYAGDVVFSPASQYAYVGAYGNTYYGGGEISIFNTENLKKTGKLKIFGAQSLAISQDTGKIYASAFRTRLSGETKGSKSNRGIVEITPKKNSLKISAVYFVSLLSTTNEPYYGTNNIFYKQAN